VVGARTVVVQRPGNRVVVVQGAAHGYVQRPVVVQGRTYIKRTYYVNQVGFVRVYRPFVFRGAPLYFYTPVVYYPAPFYVWAVGPWAFPVAYPWGWLGDPWFVYYGPYFRPYPDYARPSLWLTDFLIATTLEAAYLRTREDNAASQAAADAANPEPVESPAAMPDEVKSMVEAEIRRQLAQAQSEAQTGATPETPRNGLLPSLSDGQHTFIAPEFVEADDNNGGTCLIGQGDVVGMDALPRAGTMAQLRILASKGSDCAAGSNVIVPLSDVVEMSNHMRATVDDGLKTLRESQGKNNIPELTAAAAAEPVSPQFAANLTIADPDVAQILETEGRNADQLEMSVRADATGGFDQAPPGTAQNQPPATAAAFDASRLGAVRIGQSESEVVAIMGEPASTSFLGGLRKLFQYPSGKVTFTDGAVSEVEPSKGAAPQGASVAPPSPQAPDRPSAAARPPATRRGAVEIGQTEDQVLAILGQPLQISYLGGVRKMYEYRDQKIVFVDGQVSEVRQ
jgi:hypothetical protein